MDRRWDKSKPPQGPFVLNRDCPQAQGLVAWWPMGNAAGRVYVPDEAGKYHLTPGTAGSAARGADGRPGLQLVAASSQYLLNATTPVIDWPITLTVWGSTDGSTQTAIQVIATDDGSSGVNNFCRIVLVSNKVRANCGTGTGGAQANAITTVSYTNGELSLFGATFASDTSRTVYLNGENAVSNSDSINPAAAFTRIRVGTALTNGDAILQPWNGFLGECAIWSRALDASMHARLYNPSTRYELWYPLRSRKWFVQGAGGDVSVALTGSAATASAGTLGVSSSVAASGEAATASAGTLAPSSTAAVTGEASTAAAGTLTPSAALALTGEQSASGAGTLAPSTTIGLTGEAVTAAAGTITYNASGDVSVALTGAAVTASAGTLATGLSVAIGGEACTSATGTLAPGATLACTGSEVTTAAGTLTLGIVVPLAGLAVTAAAGTVTYQQAGSTTVALTGEAVTVSAGTLTYVRGGGGLTEYPIGHGPGMTRRDTGPAARRAANTSTRIR